jgi:hypothetical protein
LLDDSLEDLVCRHVIELTKSSVNTLGVLERHVCLAIGAEHSLRLASENDFLDALNVRVERLLTALSSTFLFSFFLFCE